MNKNEGKPEGATTVATQCVNLRVCVREHTCSRTGREQQFTYPHSP